MYPELAPKALMSPAPCLVEVTYTRVIASGRLLPAEVGQLRGVSSGQRTGDSLARTYGASISGATRPRHCLTVKRTQVTSSGQGDAANHSTVFIYQSLNPIAILLKLPRLVNP